MRSRVCELKVAARAGDGVAVPRAGVVLAHGGDVDGAGADDGGGEEGRPRRGGGGGCGAAREGVDAVGDGQVEMGGHGGREGGFGRGYLAWEGDVLARVRGDGPFRWWCSSKVDAGCCGEGDGCDGRARPDDLGGGAAYRHGRGRARPRGVDDVPSLLEGFCGYHGRPRGVVDIPARHGLAEVRRDDDDGRGGGRDRRDGRASVAHRDRGRERLADELGGEPGDDARVAALRVGYQDRRREKSKGLHFFSGFGCLRTYQEALS